MTAAIIGPLPELAWLPIERCYVDPSYQRSLDTPRSQKLIAKIAAEFSWIKFGALMTVPEGDDWKVVDGQHRAAGARIAGITSVPAVVFKAASLAEQARAFVGANRDRITMSAQALYRAQLVAGDAEAGAIDRVCAGERIKVSPHNKSAVKFAARETAAVSMLQRILRKRGEAHLALVTNILAAAWGDEPGALQSGLFMAVSMFLSEGGDEAALRRTLPGRQWRDLLAAAVNTGGVEYGRGRALCDKLKEWVAAGAPLATPARRIPIAADLAAPLKAPPRVATAPLVKMVLPPPAPPKADPKRSEEEAIAAFLAQKGPRLVMSPEQAAQFLRDAGREAVIREYASDGWRRDIGSAAQKTREVLLDGRPARMAELYAAANELRAAAGLPPVSLPLPSDQTTTEGQR